MKISFTTKLFSFVFLLTALSSCSTSDGDSNTVAASKTGRVSLLITDAPALDFDQVNVTIESVMLIRDGEHEDEEYEDDESKDEDHESDEDEKHEDDVNIDDEKKDVVLLKETRVINLLALQHFSDLLTTANVPTGTYNKIRLVVSKVELVKLNPDGTVFSTDIAKLPANGKIDLNPRGSFDVTSDGHLMIELDMDVEKSILIVANGNGYIFRPVVFVRILGDKDIKLMILDGKVLEKTASGFKLCKPNVIAVNDDCMTIQFSEDTVVQDNLIDVIREDDIADGNIVTVLGKAHGTDVDALHVVIASSDKTVQNLALFTGDATSGVDAEHVFTMQTGNNNNVVLPKTALSILIADGARIFDVYGLQVSSDNIINGSKVDVYGLAQPDLTAVSKVKAAFIIYAAPKTETDEKLSGTIASIDVDKEEMSVTVVTDVFSGDVCVDVDDAEIFLLQLVDEKVDSKEITVSDLLTGMSVDVYLEHDDDEHDSCREAEVVLATEL